MKCAPANSLLCYLLIHLSTNQELLIIVKITSLSLSLPEYMTKGSVALQSKDNLYLRLCVVSLGEHGGTGWCTKISHHCFEVWLLAHRKEDKVHFGQAGLLALPGWVTAPVLAQWLQEARDFAAEWVELRALHQNKLCGRCLRAPLQVSHSSQ